MVATFDNTVGILVKAYFDGVLNRGLCYACAVGNICAAAVGTKVKDAYNWERGSPLWNNVFATVGGKQTIWPTSYRGPIKEQIDATGYSWEQLARIEAAFELAATILDESGEFAGLMAVVDVLADIHGIDLLTAEASKLLFVKA